MTIALPITQPGHVPDDDSRHYTPWAQVKAPQLLAVTPANPAPQDPGVAKEPLHYTEWQQVVAPQIAAATPASPPPQDPGLASRPGHYTEWQPKT